MIERIIAASVRNRFLVFVFTLFVIGVGIYALKQTPLDAIPDLSDVQVIVYTDWEGRSPDLVEDQVTYPISTAFIAAPKMKFVRGESMFAHGIPISELVARVKSSNGDVGGKTFEVATTEYFVRGRGYFKSIADIENVALKVENGTPVYVKNVGSVHLGGALRRGVAELDGKGEVVGGIVVMRYGENALSVIEGIKRKIDNIKSSLPTGVRIVPTYDRSELINRSIATLREKLIEECIVVALVCLVFLWHVRSALVAIITLPIAILVSFLPMYYSHLTSNIMSLGGIAIAIGAMIDAAIIMVENAHKALERWSEERESENPAIRSHALTLSRSDVIIEAAKSVG